MAVNRSTRRRPANPLVGRYLSTDLPLAAILRGVPEPREPVVQALLYIQECLGGRRLARDAIRAAEAVPIDGADPDLLALMLVGWAELSCRIARPSDADTLLHRAQAILSERTHPEIRAAALLAESVLADTTGDKARRESLLRDSVAVLPERSPRRKFHRWELALFLARQGRAIECEGDLRDLAGQCNPRFPLSRILAVQLIDAVETGRLQDAGTVLSQLDMRMELAPQLEPNLLPGYGLLLDLMASAGSYPPTSVTGPQRDEAMPTWARVIRCLLRNEPEEALRLARVDANRLLGSVLSMGFDSCNLIRAELASGNWGAARRLLEMRGSRGSTHYLDGLFAARVELLAGNRPAAAARFAEALAAVERYRAAGRLNFELLLAREVAPLDLMTMARNTADTRDAVEPEPEPRAEASPPPDAQAADGRFIGQHPGIVEIRRLIARFADSADTVLITGETGTGKDLVARALHETSERRGKPFVAVNCGSIAEALLESELFGHERGAFTGAEKAHRGLFEEAGRGTIFLDEIGEITPRLQRAMLRVLETGEIRAVGSSRTRKTGCRVVAATNADLDKLAAEGRFRKDLLFRLQRLTIQMPPLRERGDDILLLCRHFLDAGRRPGVRATLSDEIVQAIRAYDWPGNVRELKNVVDRMRLMHSDKLVYALGDLDLKFRPVNAPPAAPASVPTAEPAGTAAVDEPGRAEPPSRVPLPSAVAPRSAMRAMDMEADQATDRMLKNGRSPLRRLERLRELFAAYGKLTRREVLDILAVSPNTATEDLKRLCEEGLIERVEPSRSSRSHYFALKKQY